MRKHGVLSETSSPRFRGQCFRILQKHLLFCICCGKIPDPFWQLQSIQKGMVISICCITAHPLNLELAVFNHLIDHAPGHLVFGGKPTSLRDMAFLTQLRILITKPFLGDVQFMINKPITFITSISKEHT